MAVTAAMVKELRETTGAGMMDTDGDMEKAVEFLREKGHCSINDTFSCDTSGLLSCACKSFFS